MQTGKAGSCRLCRISDAESLSVGPLLEFWVPEDAVRTVSMAQSLLLQPGG